MSLKSLCRAGLVLGAAVLFGPAGAQASPLTPVMVFQNAAHPVQFIMIGLIAATLGAIGVCAVKLAKPAGDSGGSAYLSGLRVGGPLAGMLGAACTLLLLFLFISGINRPVSLNELAPGFAEALVLILLGFASGAVAVIGNWAVDSRIDRAVLKR